MNARGGDATDPGTGPGRDPTTTRDRDADDDQADGLRDRAHELAGIVLVIIALVAVNYVVGGLRLGAAAEGEAVTVGMGQFEEVYTGGDPVRALFLFAYGLTATLVAASGGAKAWAEGRHPRAMVGAVLGMPLLWPLGAGLGVVALALLLAAPADVRPAAAAHDATPTGASSATAEWHRRRRNRVRWASRVLVVVGLVGLGFLVVGPEPFLLGVPGLAGADARMLLRIAGLLTVATALPGAVLVRGEGGSRTAWAGAGLGLLLVPLGTVAALVALAVLAGIPREPPAYLVSAERPPATDPVPTRDAPVPSAPSSRTASDTRPEADPEVISAGRTFRGRYHVEGHLGTGGMGRTFLAEDDLIGRRVVLKELLPHLREDDKHLAAFLREARVAGGMNHPHVVSLYDVLQADDQVVLVLEYVEGGSLAERLAEGPMGPGEVHRVADGVLQALQTLHDRGIWHRDVKSQNVLLTRDGKAKLADFGVAHMPGAATLATGAQPGTVKTMAPEQIAGGDVDGRADLYAVAAICYEMLTGQSYLDFTGMSLYEAQRAVVEEPPRLPRDDLHDDVNAFLFKGLAKAPADRFQRAEQMREALKDLRPVLGMGRR